MAEQRLIDANALLKSYDVAWMVEYDETGCGMRKKAIPTKTIEAAPTIDAVSVVRCKDCKHRSTPYSCPMRKLVMPFQGAGSYEDCTEDEGFCHMGKPKDGGAC